MRLIDADKIDFTYGGLSHIFPNDFIGIAKYFSDQVKAMPTVDAAPVAHGRWVDKGWDGDFSWRIDGRGNCWRVISCSVCGENLCRMANTAYCPHCGAKMDLPEDVK